MRTIAFDFSNPDARTKCPPSGGPTLSEVRLKPDTAYEAVGNREGIMTSTNGTSVIKLKSVAKVFLTDEVETHALSDVNLDVERGESVSIAGPSGCGKSTLLSILGLLDSASSGE